MTDSVTKNLGIDLYVAANLGPDHIPYHLLCNTHVVEKFDATNLEVLSGIEEKLKLRERLESIEPVFRGKKAIALAAMNALLKLISHMIKVVILYLLQTGADPGQYGGRSVTFFFFENGFSLENFKT